MQLIQTVTVGSGGAASIEFTNIPQDGTDLLLVVSARSAASAVFRGLLVGFNNDTTTTYTGRGLLGSGSTVNPGSSSSTSGVPGGPASANTATSDTFGNTEVYITNYAGSSNKSSSTSGVSENNDTSASQQIWASTWSQTAAITSLKVIVSDSSNFTQHSTASLYKITKA
jgi:hypothetical protein